MIRTGFKNNEEAKSVAVLQEIFAEHFTLLSYAWSFHWNVRGESFGAYHKAFEKLYKKQIDRIDNTAERIRALGALVPMREMRMVEMGLSALNMWTILNANWDRVISNIRLWLPNIPSNDRGTINFLEDLIEEMEKEAWMIRSYTEK